MKKKLIPILCLLLLFCLTACSMEAAPNFEYDKDVMIDLTKSIVTNYHAVSGATADYLLSDGDNVAKTAVAGFQQAQNTDEVGEFVGFDTTEDIVEFSNGTKGDILCSIVVKFQNRDVRVTVSYTENKLFKAQYEEQMKTLEYYASSNGYSSVEDFIQKDENIKSLNYRTTSVKEFITDLLMYSQTNPLYPYNAEECEVSAVYSTSELLVNGAKNMGVGMGVVFAVLIFIALIIYLLRFVPKLLGKEKKSQAASKAAAKQKTEAPKKAAGIPTGPVAAAQSAKASGKGEASGQAQAAGGTAVGEEVTDGELIAVITAALQAYIATSASASTSTPTTIHPPVYTDSNDKLIVRSIRRVK